jgi:hypothetical protein
MSWFSKSAAVAEPEPVIDHYEVAQERVSALKRQLDSLDSEMLAFKNKFTIRSDRYGRLLSIQSPSLSGRDAIEAEWRALLCRRDRIVADWHQALHEWSELKMKNGEIR